MVFLERWQFPMSEVLTCSCKVDSALPDISPVTLRVTLRLTIEGRGGRDPVLVIRRGRGGGGLYVNIRRKSPASVYTIITYLYFLTYSDVVYIYTVTGVYIYV